jgi:hypothetical protein
MNSNKIITNILKNKYKLEQISNLKVNYGRYQNLSFDDFITKYQMEGEKKIELFNKLFEYGYPINHKHYNYYKKFSTSDDMLEWYSQHNFISTEDLDYVAQEENFNLFNKLVSEKFSPNNIWIDKIIFLRYPGEDTIIRLYDILLSNGYEFKNNIVFYIFCTSLSYSNNKSSHYSKYSKSRPKYNSKCTYNKIIINKNDLKYLNNIGISNHDIFIKLLNSINETRLKEFPKFIIKIKEYNEFISNNFIFNIEPKKLIQLVLNNQINKYEYNLYGIINYNDIPVLSFNNFVKLYQIDYDLNVNFFESLFKSSYYISTEQLIYFLEFGKSCELVKLYTKYGFITNYQNKILTIAIFNNSKLFDDIFSIIFNQDEINFLSENNKNKFMEYIQDGFIVKNINQNNNMVEYKFNQNYIDYDKILLKKNFFNYIDNDLLIENSDSDSDSEPNSNPDSEPDSNSDSDSNSNSNSDFNSNSNSDSKIKEIEDKDNNECEKIINLYNILFKNGYEIKNNLIFYNLCLNLFLISKKNYKNNHKINKYLPIIIENNNFKNFLDKKNILISNDDLEIGKELLITRENLTENFTYCYELNSTFMDKNNYPNFIIRTKY